MALLSTQVNGKFKALFQTKMDGSYEVTLSCETTSILVEAPGYLSQTITLSFIEKVENERFLVPIRLVAIEKQTGDRPYFQTEQKQITMDNTKLMTGTATRFFEITDAFTEKKLDADLCLFYTKSGVKDCNVVSSETGLKVVFLAADIIAIEVKAKGYENYFGNLIMTDLNGQQSPYQIRLCRKINLLSLTVKNNTQRINFSLRAEKEIVLTSNDGSHFWSEILPNKQYRFQISTIEGNVLNSKSIHTSEGLNFYSLDLKQPLRSVERTKSLTMPIVVSNVNEHKRKLYFDQSSYTLREVNKQVLDTLTACLKADSEYYLKITGHTDNVGPANRNDILSEYRAKVTFNYLLEQGADASRISFTGIGSRQPDAPNDLENNKEKNRRVEIQLLKK